MAAIDFYVLESADKSTVACQLIEKAYAQNQPVYVHCASEQAALAFDDQLWAFKDNSFIPHNLITESLEPAPPVRIGHGAISEKARGILVNLSETMVAISPRFSRVITFVNDSNKEAMRDQFKQYRSEGHTLQTYKM